ncbi:hypothetical protein LINPERPRIM_LOCUS15437 [Linum perenne]
MVGSKILADPPSPLKRGLSGFSCLAFRCICGRRRFSNLSVSCVVLF